MPFSISPANARAHLGPAFGNMTEEILLDDVLCSGTESDIMDCVKSPLKKNNCDLTEGAGVSCMPDDGGPPLGRYYHLQGTLLQVCFELIV